MHDFIRGVLLCAAGSIASVASAQTSTSTFSIVSISTGWGADIFAIQASIAVINPANCPLTDLYISGGSNAGYKTHYAAALMAFASNRQISLVLDNNNCEQSRPRIISVRVLAS